MFEWEILNLLGQRRPPPLSGHTCVLYKDDLYIIGGYLKKIIFFKCNLKHKNWIEVKPNIVNEMYPISGHSAIVYHDVMYIFGGVNISKWCKYVNHLFSYHFLKNEWKRILDIKGNIPSPRAYHSGNLFGDIMVVFGGSKSINDVYFYNIPQNEWTLMKTDGDIPIGRYDHSTSIFGYHLYVFGGVNHERGFLNDFYQLNLLSLHWKNIITNFRPSPRFGHRSIIDDFGNFYIFGGCDLFLYSLKLESSSFAWEKIKTKFPYKMHGFYYPSIVYNNGKIYLFGGIGPDMESIKDFLINETSNNDLLILKIPKKANIIKMLKNNSFIDVLIK